MRRLRLLAGRGDGRDIVPQGKSAILAAAIAGDQLLVSEMRDAHSAIAAYDLRGTKLHEVALPGLGSAYVASADAGQTGTSIWFTSFTTPGHALRLELVTGATRAWHPPAVAFDPRAFETSQVFFPSKDAPGCRCSWWRSGAARRAANATRAGGQRRPPRARSSCGRH